MAELDPRLVKVTVEINGVERTYEDIRIVATGTKYANALQNEATIMLVNLTKAERDYLLTETSPYNLNRTPKVVTLEAGRESYGTEVIFIGNVVSSDVSQPPDIGVTLKCLTGNFQKGNILTRNQSATVSLNQLSKQIANDMGLGLKFQATDKPIANYAFTGAAIKQVEVMGALGGINVFIDNNFLVVKDAFTPLTGTTKNVNLETGMVGIPQFTEQGVRVKYLVDRKTQLGGSLNITSQIYPTVDGEYVIYKLGFEIANRDNPFYYIAEAARRR